MPTTICTFVNIPDGGWIILGVIKKADFAIDGVHNPAKTAEGIVHIAYNAIRPSPPTRPLRIIAHTMHTITDRITNNANHNELAQRHRQPQNNREKFSSNALSILAVVKKYPQGATMHTLQSETGLNANQIRYAMKSLLSASTIIMEGGRGKRRTVYRSLSAK
ncbi:hypothetical protein P4N68_07305 [Corynebacterium felinum]|uniref:HTH transcriptional regulator n=1 Tax=Corynebacterium felinum TaxID=131318 RepID=A0ABU2B7L7_9CORY|nr:hypothetical protein [Corynebacterium felinum]MDF5820887.1 hypothetical protein [Corynebacterium felinum]MDR7354600.1 putative HTH transcriptional regulator [Corynebacterium felinum]